MLFCYSILRNSKTWLTLALFGFVLSSGIVEAYTVRDGSALRVMATNPDSSSASFRVSDTMKVEPATVIIYQAGIAPVPPTPPVTPPTSTSTGGGSSSGRGGDRSEKYSASNWLLGRTYDELVKSREEEERFLASAPKEDKAESKEEKPSEEILLKHPKPLVVETVKLEPVKNAKPKTPTTPKKRNMPRLTFEDMSDSDQYFKMSAPEEEFLLDESLEGAENYCSDQYLVSDYDVWKPIAYHLIYFITALLIVIYLLILLLILMIIQEKRNSKKKSKGLRAKILSYFTILSLIGVPMLNLQAVESTPQLLIYEGELFDNAGSALAGDYTFRFTFWDNVDFEATDVAAGAINVAAPDYLGWEEVQTETLAPGGRFSFQMGTVEPFLAGMFDMDNLYLQVEVKNSTDPDTDYEMIDIDAADTAVDRKIIASVPFAFNANKLDYREVGLDPGNIPYIDETTGKLDSGIIDGGVASANGTDENTFTLDQNGDAGAADNLVLEFGAALGKTLLWNSILGQFEFNDDVNIDGNLVVTGTINGVSLGPVDYEEVLSARYGESILEGDGTENRGSMYEEVETVLGLQKQVLRWDTKQAVTQDYDILIKYQLPENFKEFKPTNGMVLEYRSSGSISDAKIDVTLEKEGVAGDFLSSNGIGLNNNAWESKDFAIASGGSWAAGDVIWIKMKMQAKVGFETATADVKLNMVLN